MPQKQRSPEIATESTEITEKSSLESFLDNKAVHSNRGTVSTEHKVSLAEKGTDALTHAVIGAALEVHRVLGPGLLETIYEEALCHEFFIRGISFERQKSIDVIYKDVVIKGQRVDLLVDGGLILEIKSLSALPDVATAQVLSYLRATGLKRALLINFGEQLLKNGIKRISL